VEEQSDLDRFKHAVTNGDPVAFITWHMMVCAWLYRACVTGTPQIVIGLEMNKVMGDWPVPSFSVGACGFYLHMYSLDRDAWAHLYRWTDDGLEMVDQFRLDDGKLPVKLRRLMPVVHREAIDAQLSVAWASPPCPDCGTIAPHDAGGHRERVTSKGRVKDVPVTTCRNRACQTLPTKAQKSITTIPPVAK